MIRTDIKVKQGKVKKGEENRTTASVERLEKKTKKYSKVFKDNRENRPNGNGKWESDAGAEGKKCNGICV